MIKLSIIVPVYNVEKYLDICIDSLINQSMKDGFEVIFVNDGSTDRSHSILLNRCNGKDNFHVHIKDNGGLSSARNYGISHASGQFISFLDSDDWISPCYVNNILTCIKEYEADLYYFDRAFITDKKTVHTKTPEYRGPLQNSSSILYKINISACNKVYKKSVFQNNIFPVGVIYEDFPFMFKTYSLIYNICKIPGCLYYVRKTNPNSITSSIHKQELDMLTNLTTVKELVHASNHLFLKDFYNHFEIHTLISWSMKQLRGGNVDAIKKIDFSRYDKSLIKGTLNKWLFFLLLRNKYKLISFMLFIQKVKKRACN